MVDFTTLLGTQAYVVSILIMLLIVIPAILILISKRKQYKKRVQYLQNRGFLAPSKGKKYYLKSYLTKSLKTIQNTTKSIKTKSLSLKSKDSGFYKEPKKSIFTKISNSLKGLKEKRRIKKEPEDSEVVKIGLITKIKNKIKTTKAEWKASKIFSNEEKKRVSVKKAFLFPSLFSSWFRKKEKVEGLEKIKIAKEPKKPPQEFKKIPGSFISKDVNFALIVLLIIIAASFVGATVFYELSFESINEKYEEEKAKLEKAIQDLNEKKSSLSEAEQTIEIKETREEQITGQYLEVKESLTEKESLIRELGKQNKELKEKSEALAFNVTTLTRRNRQLEGQVESLEDKLEDCQTALENCQ